MVAISVVVAYLLGSISSSTIISKQFAKIDIRNYGSGNAGATNTLRVLGAKWGLLVLVIDVLKGVIAVLIARMLTPDSDKFFVCLAGLAVIIGHNWPIFFRFKGGKGIATTIGVLLTVLTGPALTAGGVAIIFLILTRYVSLAALTFTILTPLAAIIFHDSLVSIIFSAIIAVLAVYRHRANISRLIQGSESQLFSRKT